MPLPASRACPIAPSSPPSQEEGLLVVTPQTAAWAEGATPPASPADRSQPQRLAPPPSTPPHQWPLTARCYVAAIHRAEAQVAEAVARLAGRCAAEFRLPRPDPAAAPPAASAASLDPAVVLASADPDVLRWVAEFCARLEGSREAVRLSAAQRAAAVAAASAPLLLLTGAAGCGKTFAVRAMLDVWARQGKTVKCCSPTGRAAQRLQELAGADTGLRATTVHRMLGYKSRATRSGLGEGGEAAIAAAAAGPAAAPLPPVAVAVPEPAGQGLELELENLGWFEFNEANPLEANVGELGPERGAAVRSSVPQLQLQLPACVGIRRRRAAARCPWQSPHLCACYRHDPALWCCALACCA